MCGSDNVLWQFQRLVGTLGNERRKCRVIDLYGRCDRVGVISVSTVEKGMRAVLMRIIILWLSSLRRGPTSLVVAYAFKL